MGQRLVISIETNEKTLCKLYYHWSAYTMSALYETKKVIDCIYNHTDETKKETILRLIRFCEDNGGCIDGGRDSIEGKYIQSLYPNEIFKETGSRSEGLIALSEEGMADMQRISEGDVYINLDDDTVEFCVYSGYEDIEEYIEERKSWDDEFEGLSLEDIPKIDCDLGFFSVEDIDSIIAALDSDPYIVICNGEICEFIS